MKFLIVNRHRDDVIGGSEIQCDLIARELQTRGHTVTYAVMRPKVAQRASPYACVRMDPPITLAFRRALRAARPDVVYWRFNKAHLLQCALQARLAGAVFVFASSHDDDTRFWSAPSVPPGPAGERAAPWLTLLRGVRRRWYQLADGVNYCGHFVADGHIAQHAGQARGRAARVIRSSVLTSADPFEWPRPFVVWVANLKARKRPELFLELARLLAAEPIDFLAVGALQDRRYEYLADRARVPFHFHYLGARTPSEVNGIIAAARFLVLTCEPEGFPNVLMQAWQQGKPTLSLAYDPEDMIRSNRLGHVEDSVPALAERVRALVHHGREVQETGERAARFAQQNFSLAVNASELERFCAELIARRRA